MILRILHAVVSIERHQYFPAVLDDGLLGNEDRVLGSSDAFQPLLALRVYVRLVGAQHFCWDTDQHVAAVCFAALFDGQGVVVGVGEGGFGGLSFPGELILFLSGGFCDDFFEGDRSGHGSPITRAFTPWRRLSQLTTR